MKHIVFFLTLFLQCATAAGQHYSDTLRVLCIGNSFTYVADAHMKLRELALSQGHYMEVNGQLRGGYTFRRHLNCDETLGAIVYNAYDHVFLQDQSRTPALYAKDTVRCRLIALDTAELAERVRIYSPDAHLWLEQTWSYTQGDCGSFGSLEEFDSLLRSGVRQIASRINADVSPIGEAFIICRAEEPTIDLYDGDAKHQSAYGSYLKACVNYLLLYRQPFTQDAATCYLDGVKCRKLQKIAERVVGLR